MLVLTRKIGQKIFIADEIEVTVLEVVGQKVRLGISAPSDVPIQREELYQRLEQTACLSDEFGRGLSDADNHCELGLVAAH